MGTLCFSSDAPCGYPPTDDADAKIWPNPDPSGGCNSKQEFGSGCSKTIIIDDLPHTIYLPSKYSTKVPAPVILYFHGHGGDHRECGSLCEKFAPDEGFISVALSGYLKSWRNDGSVGTKDDATCASEVDMCPRDCFQGCDDNCWWTTCMDSVALTIAVMNWVEDNLCVDKSSKKINDFHSLSKSKV